MMYLFTLFICYTRPINVFAIWPPVNFKFHNWWKIWKEKRTARVRLSKASYMCDVQKKSILWKTPSICKIEQHICCVKTIESTGTWQISSPHPPPAFLPCGWHKCMVPNEKRSLRENNFLWNLDGKQSKVDEVVTWDRKDNIYCEKYTIKNNVYNWIASVAKIFILKSKKI